MPKIKIVIAGIGGVGGYFGGLLAKAYAGNNNIEIYFIARGKHLAEIQKNGLKVIKGEVSFMANPYLATQNIAEIGFADYILACTKTYDLAALVTQLNPCIIDDTVILPLMNGVEAVDKIRSTFPNNLVPAGCAYIVSAIKDFGVVENMGTRQEIYFGLEKRNDERLGNLLDLLKSAGIEANLSNEILKLTWEKLIFLSSIATATSFFNKSVGQLLLENQDDLLSLINESTLVAKAKQINIDDNIAQKAMEHYKFLPFSATSSMQRDFDANKPQTELDSITGFMVREGKKLGVDTPNFNKAYIELKKR